MLFLRSAHSLGKMRQRGEMPGQKHMGDGEQRQKSEGNPSSHRHSCAGWGEGAERATSSDTAGKVKCELGGCGDAGGSGDCQKHGSTCKWVYIRQQEAGTGSSADPTWPSSRADTALP